MLKLKRYAILFNATCMLITSVQGWTDRLFHEKLLLPELDTISPPSFTNGTSFSSQNAIKASAAPVPVTYTNNPKIVEKWLADNIHTSSKQSATLGFDVESVPVTPWFKSRVAFEGPATVQLATPTNCLVVHLTRKFGEHYSPPLSVVKAVLGDKSIIKAGVGIDDDMLELYRFNNNIQGKSRFDLGGIASDSPGKRIGLKSLVRILLGIDLNKSRKLAVSNWSTHLTDSQIHYSARDAWAGAAVLSALEKIHPDTFSHEAISSVIENERSVCDLHNRAVLRRRVKKELKSILQQYKEYSGLPPTVTTKDLDLPPTLRKEVNERQLLIKSTAPDGLKYFDPDFLGFCLVPNN